MKRETFFLKAVVFIIGLPIIAILGWISFIIFNEPKTKEFLMFLPMFVVLYLATIPYFIALHQTMKLLSYIDNNNAFSGFSIKSLKNIKFCAITISTLFIVDLPFLFIIADKDDAPGILLFALIIVFASTVIAVFAAVLQKLLTNALEIKSENDLTI